MALPFEVFRGASIYLFAFFLFVVMGCSRTDYRLRADQEAYQLISEKNFDPKWQVEDFDISPDPRSRFFDPYDPDESPIPHDDPASALYMQRVDGKRGWSRWYEHGVRDELESPYWREELSSYTEMDAAGALQLDINSALNLAYLHSSLHQQQLETLYTLALAVSAERFRLGSQYFSGYNLNYGHQGSLSPSRLAYNPTLQRYVVLPPVEGIESNLVSVGRGSLGSPAFQASQRFATAGEVLVGFANSFVFEFTGGDANITSSLASLSFVQPLLRQAGRYMALEQLTQAERDLLAGVRSYAQFRQGLYSQIVIGDLGVTGVQGNGPTTSLQSFNGQAGVGGYLGLLQQAQGIRNTQENLNLQEKILEQLTALYDVGIIDLVQVDQFNQSVEFERSRLLREQNQLALSLDRYKINSLGLPPDLLIGLNDQLIRPFQLIDDEATELQNLITFQQAVVGQFPDDASREQVVELLQSMELLFGRCALQLDTTRADVRAMEEMLPRRQRGLLQQDIVELQEVRVELNQRVDELDQKLAEYGNELGVMMQDLDEPNRVATVRRVVVWISNLLRLIQRTTLIQARARLESIDVDTITIPSDVAYRIALQNRLDFMNGRAALVDQWRRIEIQANALKSSLNLTGATDIRTASNNPVDFRAATANARLGLEFDAPLTRLLERNAYRESLIQYQQSRRNLIKSRDELNLGIRALVRNIEQLRKDLEIQRRAVSIAIRRVDQTRASLYAPVPPPRPGQRAVPFGPTAARDLLQSLTSLRDTQNSLLATYLDYYGAKLRLARELGVMELDEQGQWLNTSLDDLPEPIEEAVEPLMLEELPPQVPEEMIRLSTTQNSLNVLQSATLLPPAGTLEIGPEPSVRPSPWPIARQPVVGPASR
jgi:outer membrane protein TolC